MNYWITIHFNANCVSDTYINYMVVVLSSRGSGKHEGGGRVKEVHKGKGRGWWSHIQENYADYFCFMCCFCFCICRSPLPFYWEWKTKWTFLAPNWSWMALKRQFWGHFLEWLHTYFKAMLHHFSLMHRERKNTTLFTRQLQKQISTVSDSKWKLTRLL